MVTQAIETASLTDAKDLHLARDYLVIYLLMFKIAETRTEVGEVLVLWVLLRCRLT
jgi:hypothetical protein